MFLIKILLFLIANIIDTSVSAFIYIRIVNKFYILHVDDLLRWRFQSSILGIPDGVLTFLTILEYGD